MNTILIIIGIVTIVYTILRICLLICIALYNNAHNSYYMLATSECVGISSDFNLLPAIELSHSTNYICIYYKWFCFYYYIDFKIHNDE